MTRVCWILTVVAGAVVSQAATAGPNANTTLVLHAVQTDFGICEIDDPCEPAPGQPLIEIHAPGEWHTIYMLARNYDNFACLQCAFAWPSDWTLIFHLEGCLPGQLGSDVGPTGSGPLNGAFAACSNCITGGASAVVSRLYMIPGTGCLELIEPAYPFGTHVESCQQEIDPIPEVNRGRVCVGPGGINTCEPTPVPVESSTWGNIKEQYR